MTIPSWWKVVLPSLAHIDSIAIYNRRSEGIGTAAEQRIDGMEVLVDSVEVRTVVHVPNQEVYTFSGLGLIGREVKLQSSDVINIAEVMVMGVFMGKSTTDTLEHQF